MAHIGIDARLWTKTGVGRYIRNLVIELAKNDDARKHSFSLFMLSEDKHLVPQLPGNFQIVPADFYWHSISEQVGFLRVIKKSGVDLVHFTYSPAPFFYKGPFVITIHDLIMMKLKTGKASTLPYPLYALKHEVYKKLLMRSMHRAMEVIVPTHAIENELMDEFFIKRDKLMVTYEGFDALIKADGRLPDKLNGKKFFLYVGNAYPHKNLETLVAGFKLFQEKHPGYVLVLVGKKDFFYERLSGGFGEFGKSSIFHLKGVSDSELSVLYSCAVAFVTASKAEGFGLPILESLSHGTPVVVSNIPVFHEVASIGSVFFDPEDSQALANSMEYVVKQSNILKKEIQKGKKSVLKQFSWDSLARQTMSVYENCIGL